MLLNVALDSGPHASPMDYSHASCSGLQPIQKLAAVVMSHHVY